MKTEDKAAVISELAINKKDRVCEKALDIFISVLGAHAGNLVITLLATGGVYLGGGIPHKILPKLQDGVFTDSFINSPYVKIYVLVFFLELHSITSSEIFQLIKSGTSPRRIAERYNFVLNPVKFSFDFKLKYSNLKKE
ncbi:MAG: glucokinase [Ignavibacteriaceae bacterium]